MIIVNADDFGRSPVATDNSLVCFHRGRITSASAMVYMADSRRAAELAQASRLDAGLHLNLDLPLDDPGTPARLRERHLRIVRYFRLGRWPQVIYNPLIRKDLAYAFEAQCEEYGRLFGSPPSRIDGHHHLHLSVNVLLARLLPPGRRVRRSFTFAPGEKGFLNRAYRGRVDRCLARRHVCTDAFFSIEPIRDLSRLSRIISMARASEVELMVHPGVHEEAAFLLSPQFESLFADIPRGPFRRLTPEIEASGISLTGHP